MQNRCKNALLNIKMNGTKLDKEIASILLQEQTQDTLNKIVDLSNICGISLSSASRFITKIGYPSFKHFIFEYSDKRAQSLEGDEEKKDDPSYIQEISNRSQDLIKNLKGDIYILTSRRGKSIGKLMHERLNDGKITNYLFHESQDNVEEFVKIAKRNTLILVSLSGYSNLFSKAIHEVAKLEDEEKPNIIILTAAQWMKIFEKYEYISIGKLRRKKYDLEEWKDYNLALLDIMSTIIIFLNEIYKIK